jgi:hypothetical protein
MTKLAVESAIERVMKTKDLKPLRSRAWFVRLAKTFGCFESNPRWAYFQAEDICHEIVTDTGFKAAREDIWRRLRYDQMGLARASGIKLAHAREA